METKFTTQINQLREKMIETIKNYLISNNIIKLKLEDSVNLAEDSFNHLIQEGAELIVEGKIWYNVAYESFSIEELDNIITKLNPDLYEVVVKGETKTAYKIALWEYEKGWGSKLDDWVICLTEEDALHFKETFNSGNKETTVPDWYMIVKGEPETIELNLHQYAILERDEKIYLSQLNHKYI